MEKKIKLIVATVLACVLVSAGIAVSLLMKDDDGTVVRYVVYPPPQMGDMLELGDVSAYIAWEPFVSSATVDGYGRVLNWSDEIMPNHPCCVVVLSNEFSSTAEGLEIASRFLKAHVEGTTWMLSALVDTDSPEYSLLVNMSVDFTQRDADIVVEALEHVKFGYEMTSEFTAALERFTDMYIESGIVEEDTVQNRGYSDVSDFVDGYVNETYLASLDAISPSPTILNPDDPVRLGFLAGDIHQMAQVVAGNSSVTGDGLSLFETYGVKVVDAAGAPFNNGGDEMNAFVGGYVDIGYLGAPPAILKRLNVDADTTIIAQVNSEGSAIVVSSDSNIHSLDDLAGELVATPGESSIQHLLLKIALNERGLRLVKA